MPESSDFIFPIYVYLVFLTRPPSKFHIMQNFYGFNIPQISIQ